MGDPLPWINLPSPVCRTRYSGEYGGHHSEEPRTKWTQHRLLVQPGGQHERAGARWGRPAPWGAWGWSKEAGSGEGCIERLKLNPRLKLTEIEPKTEMDWNWIQDWNGWNWLLWLLNICYWERVGIIHHQKVICSPQKCALIPQNRSFYHISLTFSLTKMIYALLSKNVAFTRFSWPNSPRCQH